MGPGILLRLGAIAGYSEQRITDNPVWSSLLLLEADLLQLRRCPTTSVKRVILQDDRVYPPELQDAIEELAKISNALFDHMMAEDVTAIWIRHAMQPGGAQNVTVADMSPDWAADWPRLAQEPDVGTPCVTKCRSSWTRRPCRHVSTSKRTTAARSPDTATSNYRPEHGYQAVVQIARVKANSKG